MPASLAIAIAVILLSPVTILTVTPPSWHRVTASLIPSLKGSLIPTMAKIMRFPSTWLQSSGTDFSYL